MSAKRVILMLHGPTSRFWRELGSGFELAGCRVIKVNFAFGEALYWRKYTAINYRGRLSNWRSFLEELVERESVTDILYYADRFSYHVVARSVADERGIRAYAVENGYLRPDWITLERGGMGAYSHVPDNPVLFRSLSADLPEPDLEVRYPVSFWVEIFSEITYHWLNFFWKLFYPYYQSGKYYNSVVEILIGIPPMLQKKMRSIAADAVVEACQKSERPYFVVPLQLQGDYQIRDNSRFGHIREMITEVMVSFSRHAEIEAELIFKQHPHDNGAENFMAIILREAERLNISDRVFYIDGGDLGRLLSKAKGCIIVNSTVGLFSLRCGCPTKVLGVAVYDMTGLTHQGTMDSFWQSPAMVESELCDAFVRVIAKTIQIKGSFYHPEGRKRAIETIIARILAGQVNEPGAFINPPPRLAKARAEGVPVDRVC